MKTVNLSDQEIKELIEDGIRFRSLVEFERTVATNKWLIQILWSTRPYPRGSFIRPHKELNRVLK